MCDDGAKRLEELGRRPLQRLCTVECAVVRNAVYLTMSVPDC